MYAIRDGRIRNLSLSTRHHRRLEENTMNLKTCLALIGTLIATSILIDSASSGSNVQAAGVLVMSSYPSAAVPERGAKQIGAAEVAYRSDCYAPRLVAVQLVGSVNGLGAGHRLVGGSGARQITCARG
jgi:nitrate/nitrite-specific signal transduction histidine kinase